MTINAPAAIMLAFYVVAAERSGVPRDQLGGTIQADILKEYIAQKEWCFPVEPAMRLLGDMMEWCTRDLPRWHPISISGYHIREAGSTAAQELAFTLKNGLTYVERAIARGDRRRRLRAAAELLLQRADRLLRGDREVPRGAADLGARDARHLRREGPASLLMRFHTQTAGVSLTAQQPLNNIVRTAIEALAGVLGGTQSLHTNSYDEALALPTEEAVRIALRTQQMIAGETGVTNTADPLGGSYFVEALTDRMEALGLRLLPPDRRARRDGRGGQRGFPQREIADASYVLQHEIEAGDRVVVGVNRFTRGREGDRRSCGSTRRSSGSSSTGSAVRARRDGAEVERVAGARCTPRRDAGQNLMPLLVDARACARPRARSWRRSRKCSASTARRRSSEMPRRCGRSAAARNRPDRRGPPPVGGALGTEAVAADGGGHLDHARRAAADGRAERAAEAAGT